MKKNKNFTLSQISHVIELAWADDITFEAIKDDTGLDESEVIKVMQKNLKSSSFRMWRKRVSCRTSKHEWHSQDSFFANDTFWNNR